jgi:hypothetical protein
MLKQRNWQNVITTEEEKGEMRRHRKIRREQEEIQ